jgi:hypothetical protein
LIAMFWWILPSVYLLKCLTLASWAGTGYYVSQLSTRFYTPAAGHFAAALFLFYFYQLYAATTLYPQTVAGFLVVASVVLVMGRDRMSPTRQILLAGTSILQIFMIPNCIVVAAVIYPYAIWRRKIGLWSAVTAGAVIMVAVLAWCDRNERAIRGFSFTTTMGITLYEGAKDELTAEKGISFEDAKRQVRGLPEIEIDKFFRRDAMDWIKSHPWSAAILTLRKFAYWFAYKNDYETKREVPMMALLSGGAGIIYYLVLAGSLVAIGAGRRDLSEFAILAWIIYLAAAISYAFFLTRIRYRLHFDGLLIAASSGMLLHFSQVAWQKLGKFREREASRRGL